jgi:O-methyltransferase involved in polyketide biosynthesis
MSHPPHAERVQLEGVSETTLWTLYQRASEATRADCVLHDPMAVELVRTIDFPFEQRFGRSPGWAQWQALRARTFDREVRRFLRDHPSGTVIALGEGLETQFWRVNNGRVRWIGVDLPPVIELRRQLLPESPNHELVASPVVDGVWLDELDETSGSLVTAQGLLMYLDPTHVHELIAACAARIGEGALLFDAVPRWLSEASCKGAARQVRRHPAAAVAARPRRRHTPPPRRPSRSSTSPRRDLLFGLAIPASAPAPARCPCRPDARAAAPGAGRGAAR